MSAQPVEETPTVSLRARIACLQPGETTSESVRVPLDGSAADLAEVSEKLRNKVSPAVARAKAHTGFRYTVENGSYITRGDAVIVTVAITRIG